MSERTLEPLRSRPESITELVYDSIREAIVERRLAPGSRVTEGALAAQLSVSKTPVREALVRLSHIGLIESDGHRGGRVVTPSRTTIRSAYEVRAGLEAQAARLVAERGSEMSIGRVKGLAIESARCAESGDPVTFRRADREFHLSIAAATENAGLEQLIRDTLDLTWTLRLRDVPVSDDLLKRAMQHVEIAAAIEARDSQQADERIREHITEVQNLLLDSLEESTA